MNFQTSRRSFILCYVSSNSLNDEQNSIILSVESLGNLTNLSMARGNVSRDVNETLKSSSFSISTLIIIMFNRAVAL